MLFFSKIKVKISHKDFASLNEYYFLDKKNLTVLFNRLKNKDSWLITFSFNNLSKKDLDFISREIGQSLNGKTKEEVAKIALNHNIQFI